MSFLKIFPAIAITLAVSTAHGQSTGKPLILRIKSPKPGSIQYESGWPLQFTIRPRNLNATTIVNFGSEEYPAHGDHAALIMTSPSSLGSSECSSLLFTCPPGITEPPYLEFAIDTDYPDRPDSIFAGLNRPAGADQPANQPIYSYGYNPADPNDTRDIKLGPIVSDARNDGIGYGPNDDLPGFVLLSNVGVGRVLTATTSFAGSAATLQEMSPRQARNLAGLMTDVSMELVRTSTGTVIYTGMQVTHGLFAPIILWDHCTGGLNAAGQLCRPDALSHRRRACDLLPKLLRQRPGICLCGRIGGPRRRHLYRQPPERHRGRDCRDAR